MRVAKRQDRQISQKGGNLSDEEVKVSVINPNLAVRSLNSLISFHRKNHGGPEYT